MDQGGAPRELSAEPHVFHGGCYCGRVRFKVSVLLSGNALNVIECNCSICTMTGFVHLIVPAARFELLQGEAALVDYRCNTRVARHRFCGTCGIKCFYTPRSHPDGIDVNARCLEGFSNLELCTTLFDDGDREFATAAIAHLSQAG